MREETVLSKLLFFRELTKIRQKQKCRLNGENFHLMAETNKMAPFVYAIDFLSREKDM